MEAKMSKLGLDEVLVARARDAAEAIAARMDEFIRRRTTVAVERTVARLFGVDGANEEDIPYPNRLVDALVEQIGRAHV
jgi:beta-lysine 5,6-aminomutase alpha subunit